MWLEKIKRFPLVSFFYKIPGLAQLYHFILAFFGAIIYGFPSRNIFVIGVTGTKGKTTTLELINAILEEAGKKTALLSSLRIKIDKKSEKNIFENTMPGRFFIQRFLNKAVKVGCKYALIEVTSQGVALSRHRFVNWKIGVITNLAPEHIEAHGSFEKYREAKLRFLQYVIKGGGKVFINKEDAPSSFFIKNLPQDKIVFYNTVEELVLETKRASGVFLGRFNQENVSAAVAVAKELGIKKKTVKTALKNFKGVPGRFEFVQTTPFSVVIDYAHTPDSLEAVYKTLRGLKPKIKHLKPRLICVLGSAGGGRDKWKRPEMGKIASEYCNEIILTNEDPYDEDPSQILLEIKSGISNFPTRLAPARLRVAEGKSGRSQREAGRQFPISNFHEILDRREAIKKAISLAKDGDIVVLTGKGSESWIHIAKGGKIPWGERGIVEEVLKKE